MNEGNHYSEEMTKPKNCNAELKDKVVEVQPKIVEGKELLTEATLGTEAEKRTNRTRQVDTEVNIKETKK